MPVALPALHALVFAPLVLPICLHVIWTDLAGMRISNRAVLALAAVFIIIGPFLYPLDVYGWRLITLVAVLLVGVVLNAAGVMGAGDAKFIAAASPFFAPGDLHLVIALLAAMILAAFATHRIARHTALRQLAPHWESWTRKRDFPMGFALGGTLGAYLVIAAFSG